MQPPLLRSTGSDTLVKAKVAMCRFTGTCGSPRQRRRKVGGFGACTPFGVKQQHITRASCLCKQSIRICSARRMVQPSRRRCVDLLSGAGAKARGTPEALRCASLSACNTSTTPGHRVVPMQPPLLRSTASDTLVKAQFAMCRFTVTCGSPRQRRRKAGGFGACTPFGVKQQHNTSASCLCKQSFRICSARRMVQPSRQRCVDRLSGAGAKARGTLEALRCASVSACNTSTTPGHRVCANAASASALDSQ